MLINNKFDVMLLMGKDFFFKWSVVPFHHESKILFINTRETKNETALHCKKMSPAPPAMVLYNITYLKTKAKVNQVSSRVSHCVCLCYHLSVPY